MQDSFLRRVIASFEARSSRPAMRIVGDDSEVYTFGESLRSIRSLAYQIGQSGVSFGDRIALIGENHPCWALSYLGILYRGAVCVPLDPHGETETITNFLENSEAKLAFIGAEFKEQFKVILDKLGRHIPAVVWEQNESANDFESSGFQSFRQWSMTEFPSAFENEMPKAANGDLALLIYTSGTTGTPKGVPLTHGNIVAELDGINEVLKLTEKETILSLLPLFHAYLQIVNLWVATTYGCQAGYLKELSPAELSSAMAEFKPTILTTVPRLWYLFHKKIFDAVEAKPKTVQLLFRSMLAFNGFSRDVLRINLGRTFFGKVHAGFGGQLRLAISAGSRFDEDVARDFHRLGFTILQGYGLTETSGAATATYENDNRIGSVGKPLFNSEVKIDRPRPDGVGEVLIRGDVVFSGYYKNPTATDDAFTEDGWFRSGDLGRFDKDGHLFIVGRAKDVIVLPSGKNVHPEDLEVHYLKAPEVEELAVLGVKDESESRAGAEKLIAVVVPDFEYLKHEKIANSKEAIRYALDNLGRELPEYQRVRDYIVRAEPLPRTATRKIKRFELKKELENGRFSLGLPEAKSWQHTADDERFMAAPVSRIVIDAILQHSKEGERLHPDMNLEIDLGLDSLARAEFFAGLEHAFESEFTAEEAAGAVSIRQVVDLVSATEKGREIANASGGVELSAGLNWSSIIRTAAEDMPEVRAILRRRPFFEAFAFTVYRTFNIFCRLFMRLEVEGLENLRKAAEHSESGFLISPNHQSFLDPFVLCSTYPFHIFRNVFHVGAKMFFETRTMRFVARLLNVVPIDQDTQLMRAMKAGAIGLKHGKILNIYPEGERAFDGNLHEFKKGAAILATELELPIVPVALDGLQNVWARRSSRIRPAKVKIQIGEPFFANEVVASKGRIEDDQKYELVTSHLKDAIANMIDEMRASHSRKVDAKLKE
jgi:long-chain acyl-CoA synthetase